MRLGQSHKEERRLLRSRTPASAPVLSIYLSQLGEVFMRVINHQNVFAAKSGLIRQLDWLFKAESAGSCGKLPSIAASQLLSIRALSYSRQAILNRAS